MTGSSTVEEHELSVLFRTRKYALGFPRKSGSVSVAGFGT